MATQPRFAGPVGAVLFSSRRLRGRLGVSRDLPQWARDHLGLWASEPPASISRNNHRHSSQGPERRCPQGGPGAQGVHGPCAGAPSPDAVCQGACHSCKQYGWRCSQPVPPPQGPGKTGTELNQGQHRLEQGRGSVTFPCRVGVGIVTVPQLHC